MASAYGTDADKRSLRDRYLVARRALGDTQRARCDAAICEGLLADKDVAAAPLVLTYVSYGAEVDTRAFIAAALARGQRVAVPRIHRNPDGLIFYEIKSLLDLCPGTRGILEPTDEAVALYPQDLVGSVCLIPGLVFDGEGARVGHGGGFYDRFLAFYPGDKIGLVRTAHISSNPLPQESHDVRVDFLASENGVWPCR